MASTDATPQPIKNQAYRLTFPLWLTTGLVNSGASGLDSEISKDAGTFADCTNEATEIATSSGVYYLDLTSTEMNADTVAIQVKSSTTNAITGVFTIYPNDGTKVQANTVRISGTSQTARDIGASVLLSAGTGTGQLDFTSGVVKSNLVSILGTALTETSGLLAGGFKKFFNVSSPTGTLNSLPAAIPGAANGLWILGTNNTAAITIGNLTASAIACTTITASGAVSFQSTFDITGIMTVSGGITADINGTIASVTTLSNLPSIPVNWITATGIASNAITSAKFAAGTTIPRVTLADTVTTVTGLTASNLDATVSSRLAASAYTAPDNTSITAIKTKTDFLPSVSPGSAGGLIVVGTNATTTFSGSGLVLANMFIGGVATVSQTADSKISLTKIQAAVYDSVSLVGDTMSYSNGATAVVSATGRVLTP